MEMVIAPKKQTKRRKKVKQEDPGFGYDDYHSAFGSSLLQKAVDTIICRLNIFAKVRVLWFGAIIWLEYIIFTLLVLN